MLWRKEGNRKMKCLKCKSADETPYCNGYCIDCLYRLMQDKEIEK